VLVPALKPQDGWGAAARLELYRVS
jgi:hypothetical protein